MSTIKWVKTYEVTTTKGNFRIFVSEREGGDFYASCLYYEGNRALKASTEAGLLTFDLKTKYGKTEQEAFQQIVAWARERYGNDINVNELNS